MTVYSKVLIDDLRSFKERNAALVLRTEENALAWLASLSPEDTVEELWLDHDLGLNDAHEVTSIMSFVSKLEEMAYFQQSPSIRLILIHTSNPVGGRAVESALNRFFTTRKVYAGDYFTV